jgi:hypothetical protein
MRELQFPQMTECVERYRRNWKEYADKMNSGRIPEILNYCRVSGRGWVHMYASLFVETMRLLTFWMVPETAEDFWNDCRHNT